MSQGTDRPVALVTGASRSRGLGAAIAVKLARQGWDIAATYWTPYDESMPWGVEPHDPSVVAEGIESAGGRCLLFECDLADVAAPTSIFDKVEDGLGSVAGLVVNHTHCVGSGLYDTTADSLDQHYAVNVRATWLLLKEFGQRFSGEPGTGRVVALTSDHTFPGNVPYGATKAAADRLILAAAQELGPMGVTANVVNPGPVDTGWMTDEVRASTESATLIEREGEPRDVANLVAFLFSSDGGWITGQLLYSNGGFRGSIP